MILGFVRLTLLARLLLPQHFGVVALAGFFVGLSMRTVGLGLDTAMIHRQEDGENLKGTYLSLRLLQVGLVALVLIAVAPFLQNLYPEMNQLREMIISLAIIFVILAGAQVQETIMRKEFAFSGLALCDVASAIGMTTLAPLLAWMGWGIWALVAESGINAGVRLVLSWGPFRRWRPNFKWDKVSVRFFWRYGKPVWVKTNLVYVLDQFDDFWIGTALGQIPLGYYTRAYSFSRTPRRVFAFPLIKVFEPVFARLQSDRRRLSQAFYRSAHILLRVVFLGAGLFALVMPEFIALIIGEKWLPMLAAFRLLLIYAAFDSLFMLMSSLLTSVGNPQALRNVTIIQTLLFIPGVIAGAYWAGINGVAVAANVMLLTGIAWSYRPVRAIVDVSFWHLVKWPVFALTVAFGCGLGIEIVVTLSMWQLLFVKIGVFLLFYIGILILMERKEYMRDYIQLWKLLVRPATQQ